MSIQVQSFPPITSPMVDKNFILTPIWARWFSTLFVQTGTSNSSSLTSIIATVSAIQATQTSHQNEIGSIGCGRQL